MRSRGISSLGSPGKPGNAIFPSFMGSTRGDSVASQSHFCLPTVTGLTGLSGSEAGFGLRQSAVNKPSSSQFVDTDEVIDLKDVPLADWFNKNDIKKRK